MSANLRRLKSDAGVGRDELREGRKKSWGSVGNEVKGGVGSDPNLPPTRPTSFQSTLQSAQSPAHPPSTPPNLPPTRTFVAERTIGHQHIRLTYSVSRHRRKLNQDLLDEGKKATLPLRSPSPHNPPPPSPSPHNPTPPSPSPHNPPPPPPPSTHSRLTCLPAYCRLGDSAVVVVAVWRSGLRKLESRSGQRLFRQALLHLLLAFFRTLSGPSSVTLFPRVLNAGSRWMLIQAS
ncbi:hypothetical protein Pmani_003399 [Petrolisthes manimaculis]|uniref:Uncharacterized protein n=1 Tax=Petrolisthes manimaculis TaxID=1843537 RepID=A0AAE1UMI7_9EUCA|nr:hypothetical protein Pmani_003399 [Petrolisthes manimaculis]